MALNVKFAQFWWFHVFVWEVFGSVVSWIQIIKIFRKINYRFRNFENNKSVFWVNPNKNKGIKYKDKTAEQNDFFKQAQNSLEKHQIQRIRKQGLTNCRNELQKKTKELKNTIEYSAKYLFVNITNFLSEVSQDSGAKLRNC